jgi:thiol-disulfide isomerase/thioredoxin
MVPLFKYTRHMLLTAATVLSGALLGAAPQRHSEDSYRVKPSFRGATRWFNTPEPVNLADLHGKVVLVDFWTFTCINWRRTLPYVRAWAEKYREQGLIVVGIHTPEFSFEQKAENISNAIREMNIGYPVAVDNNFDIWRSFDNHFWPALYLIDAKGKLRYQKFGEGDYAEAESMIQQLLKEVSPDKVPGNLVTPQAEGFEVAADWDNLGTPENYVGYERTQGFASPEGMAIDKRALYALPAKLQLNQWALEGTWTAGQELIASHNAGSKVVYRFHARDLHLIMGPAVTGKAVKFRVLIDGNPPGSAHGLDIDSNGNGIVTGQRMYQLIRQQAPIADREFQIEFLDPGVELFDFTFG